MNQVVSFIIIMIIINGSAGFLMGIMPNVFGDDDVNTAFPYAVGYGDEVNNTMGGELAPESLLEDKSDAFDRLLDAISLGFFKRAQKFIESYIHGVPIMLEKIFGEAFPPGLKDFLNTIINLSYVFTIVWLFTNKVFNKS